MARGPAAATIVCQRLCLLLSTACCLSGAEALRDLVALAVALPGTVEGVAHEGACQAACSLLLSIAEEVEGSDKVRREALTAILLPSASAVLGLMDSLLGSSLAAPEGGIDPHRRATHESALKCLEGWLRLDPDATGSSPLVSAAALLRSHPALLHSLLGHLGSFLASPALFNATVSALVELFRPGGRPLAGSPSLGPGDEAAALRLASQALVAQLEQLQQAKGSTEGAEALAVGLCKVATALAELSPELACGPTIPEALGVAEVVLRCCHPGLTGGSGAPLEAACEYFLMVNLVPLEERAEPFRAPLFQQLVPLCLQLATFPDAFTTWDVRWRGGRAVGLPCRLFSRLAAGERCRPGGLRSAARGHPERAAGRVVRGPQGGFPLPGPRGGLPAALLADGRGGMLCTAGCQPQPQGRGLLAAFVLPGLHGGAQPGLDPAAGPAAGGHRGGGAACVVHCQGLLGNPGGKHLWAASGRGGLLLPAGRQSFPLAPGGAAGAA